MQSLCVLLVLLGVTLADPTIHFMEKFETGKTLRSTRSVLIWAVLVGKEIW